MTVRAAWAPEARDRAAEALSRVRAVFKAAARDVRVLITEITVWREEVRGRTAAHSVPEPEEMMEKGHLPPR